MFNTRHDLSFGCAVAGEFVRDHHTRCYALLLKQLSQQAFGRFGIAPALNQDVEYGPVLIHGARANASDPRC